MTAQVTFKDLQEWQRIFTAALDSNRGYLFAYQVTLFAKALFIQYIWKEEPWEGEPYVHEFTINKGDSVSSQRCLNDYRLTHIYGHQRKLRAWKNNDQNEVIITVGGKCDRDLSGDGNNPYSKGLTY